MEGVGGDERRGRCLETDPTREQEEELMGTRVETMTTIRMLAVPALCALLAAPACTRGSGDVVERSIPVDAFSRIVVDGSFTVDVELGGDPAVTLEVDDNVLKELDVRVVDDTLRIGLDSANVVDATLLAHVTAQALTSVSANGAAHVRLAGPISAGDVELHLTGGSTLAASFDADRVELGASGAANATLSGTAVTVAIVGSGASSIDAEDLDAVDVGVRLSGGSRATISASGSISAEVSGGSALPYRGSPTFALREVSGGSSIEGLT
jgi:hypothetical protein